MQTVAEISNELNRQVVANFFGRDVTRADLDRAFNQVAPANWKAAIDVEVSIDTAFDRVVMLYAVEFFTGSKPSLEHTATPNMYRLVAAGYYAAVGA